MDVEKTERLNFVCVDNSDLSYNAFLWYLEHYHKDSDIVGLVHAHEMPPLSALGLMAGGMVNTGEYYKEVHCSFKSAKEIEKKFETICKNKGLKHEFFLACGHNKPGHVICELAKEKKADTIFMGQRGLGHLSRLVLGSVSDFVVHHAEVPVIVVPGQK